jgi:hypothetical protein
VQDLDGEVLALLAEHLLHLLLEDLSSPMMGVDDLVTDLVARRLEIDLEVLDEVLLNQYVANDSLLRPRRMAAPLLIQVCR